MLARSSLRVALLATALCAALGTARTAAADPAAAERLFVQASAAYRRGDFLVAAEAFEAAFREEPAGAALYNAGLSWQSAGEPGRAADAYARALEMDGLDPHDDADAKQRLSALERKLGVLELRGDAGTKVTVAHAKGRDVPTRIHLVPGSHELRVTMPDGQLRYETVRITAAEPTTVELAVTKSGPEPLPAASPVPTTDIAPREPAPPEAEKPVPSSPLPAIGGVTLALGVGTAVAAIALGVKALDARDEFNASGLTDVGLHDKAASLRTAANVCWVGTGVLATAGVVMLVVYAASEPPEDPVQPSTQAVVRLGPAGAWLEVRY